MDNKYQQALNCIKLTQVNFTDFGSYDLLQDFLPSDWIDTLQELVDLYENESKYESFAEIHKDHQEEITKLEKALEIACRKYADMKDNYRIDYLKQGCVETRWCNWQKVKANILKEVESEKQ